VLSTLAVDTLLVSSVTAIAVASAAAAVFLVTSPRLSRLLVPFGAGLLIGMALFGMWPEVSERMGWLAGLGVLSSGFLLLWIVNRFVHPVCPSCSHTHDHGACEISLHGFAPPLVIAAVLHSLMDGLAIPAAGRENPDGLAWGVFLAIAIHKVPEGLAYGTILRAAVKSRLSAIGWCLVAQFPTIVGGVAESLFAPDAEGPWTLGVLALAGGSFLFLGYHAVHGELRRRGATPALAPALVGLAGAAIIQLSLHSFHG
jgi:zinc transporter ZupT